MKILNLLLAAGMAMSLNAAKLTGPDDNGRLYNTGYLDIKSNTQSPVYDVISYSKRTGTFNWEKIYTLLHSFNADKMEFILKTRVQIPQDITTPEVYLSVGENFYFQYRTNNGCCYALSADTKFFATKEIESSKSESFVSLSTKINEQLMQSGTSILSKTKKDMLT
jgi:hypothetical protein